MKYALPAFIAFIAATIMTGCSSTPKSEHQADPYVWLETLDSPEAKAWVEARNKVSRERLEGDARYAPLKGEVKKILAAKDRIVWPSQRGKWIRNFWQDEKHIRGIWRQTTFEEYAKAEPRWTTLLDIDALNKAENKSWVFAGSNCLPPEHTRCLVRLSDGGKDKAIMREFDTVSRTFIKGGFELPEAKSRYDWIDKDTLFLQTDFGEGSLTVSGYPRHVRIWRRGQAFKDATLVFEGKTEDVSVSAYRNLETISKNSFIGRYPNFYEQESFWYKNGQLIKLPIPSTAEVTGDIDDFIFFSLRHDWQTGGKTYPAGALLSLPLASVKAQTAAYEPEGLETVFEPDNETAFAGFSVSKNYLYLSILRNVRTEIYQLERKNGAWARAKLPFPEGGRPALVDTASDSDRIFASFEDFGVPTSLYVGEGASARQELKLLKSLPPRFDASGVTTEQHFATSRDGTKVPYFVVRKRGRALDGNSPAILYGYGGFENAMTPSYMQVLGKTWVEKGGVYVLANIRGGGEYGPRWHKAALKENRQRAYDDFAAIAQDLFVRKITSPRRLGIWGASNGGLLTGVSMTQNPSLYRAVIVEAALLDMLRYTKLPPGASWIGEYGDPDKPEEAAFIRKYSPYQNIKKDAQYPLAFFYSSTFDDRVHPGHTRKMVARMEELGHKALMFERTEGGHGGAADLDQRAEKTALSTIYLYQMLMD